MIAPAFPFIHRRSEPMAASRAHLKRGRSPNQETVKGTNVEAREQKWQFTDEADWIYILIYIYIY